jgi:methionine sulfoxide reductase catalytic subunit
MNHIVMGTDELNHRGMILGFVGIGAVALSWVAAHYISWIYPRILQHVQKFITYPLMLTTLNRLSPSEHYTEADISPRFWPNGKMPERDDCRPSQLIALLEYPILFGANRSK